MQRLEQVKGFKKTNELHGGHQLEFKFSNDYGASVVKHSFSYGGRSNKWEVAVIDSDNKITYKTSITNDVIGYLSIEEVLEVLEKIRNL